MHQVMNQQVTWPFEMPRKTERRVLSSASSVTLFYVLFSHWIVLNSFYAIHIDLFKQFSIHSLCLIVTSDNTHVLKKLTN